MKTLDDNRLARGAELFIFFGLLPLFPLTGLLPRPWFIWLYLLAIPAFGWMRRSGGSTVQNFWAPLDPHTERAYIPRLLIRFVVSAMVIALGTWWFAPSAFLQFPAERPLVWAAVMILYPLVAVYPQEFLFRAFFLRRYAVVIPSITTLLVASAMMFGWAHVGFGHWVSIVLSALGGSFFAHTYHATGSLRLACLEHALYGDLVFTVGLGSFFYSGWYPS